MFTVATLGKISIFLYRRYFMVWHIFSLENVLGVQKGSDDGTLFSLHCQRDEGGNNG